MPDIELPILTERLILRRFEAEDLERFHGYQSLPETARFLLRPELTQTKSMEVLGRYANFDFKEPGDWVCLAIERQDQPGLMGEVVLKWLDGPGQAEVGWILHPDARGQGIATEAAEAVLDLAFGLLAFHRVDAKLDALNTGSAGICQRIGMRKEASLVDIWHYKGQWATEDIYAILDSEWRARRVSESEKASQPN
ncbi:GNAT family protein [Paenarthrobacter sp. S56]|uniref:GNAT family N-acetyltransferase n=1 Tax=Paenarthrobacter sp. S56 TaxID=3138179 RepID=UPI00321B45E6